MPRLSDEELERIIIGGYLTSDGFLPAERGVDGARALAAAVLEKVASYGSLPKYREDVRAYLMALAEAYRKGEP